MSDADGLLPPASQPVDQLQRGALRRRGQAQVAAEDVDAAERQGREDGPRFPYGCDQAAQHLVDGPVAAEYDHRVQAIRLLGHELRRMPRSRRLDDLEVEGVLQGPQAAPQRLAVVRRRPRVHDGQATHGRRAYSCVLLAPVPDPATPSLPATVRIAAVLVVIEALAIIGYAALQLSDVGEGQSPLAAGTWLFFGVYGSGLLLAARGLWHRVNWARGR